MNPMASNAKITIGQISALASDQSYQRGQKYYEKGDVSKTSIRANVIEGYCQGSRVRPYRVQVKLDAHNVIKEFSCNCKYDWGGACKHVVAVLLTYVNHPEQFAEVPKSEDILAERSKEELIALIRKMVDRYPDLQTLIDRPVVRVEAAQKPVDLKPFRRELKQGIRSYYDQWSDENNFLDSVYSIAEAASEYAEKGDWKNASAIYRMIVEECLTASDDVIHDDEGEGVEALNHVLEELAKCLGHAEIVEDDTERRAIFDTLLDAFIWDVNIGGGIGLADDAPDIIVQYGRQPDIQIIRQKIWDAQKQKIDYGYGTGWAEEVYQNFLNDLDTLDNVDPEVTLSRLRHEGMYNLLAQKLLDMKRTEEALKIIKDYLNTPYEILRMLPSLIAAGQDAIALQLAHANLDSSHANLIGDWLLHYYQTRGNHEAYFQVMLRQFQKWPHPHLYQQLKAAAKAVNQWDSTRAELVKMFTQEMRYESLIKLYLDDEAWDLAWKTLDKMKKAPGQQAWTINDLEFNIAQKSRHLYPERALPLYQKRIRAKIEQRSRPSYAEAAEMLIVVRDLYFEIEDEEEWLDYFLPLRDEFRKLPALQDELRKAGL
jgi:uncharacterized Zn finger protein